MCWEVQLHHVSVLWQALGMAAASAGASPCPTSRRQTLTLLLANFALWGLLCMASTTLWMLQHETSQVQPPTHGSFPWTVPQGETSYHIGRTLQQPHGDDLRPS